MGPTDHVGVADGAESGAGVAGGAAGLSVAAGDTGLSAGGAAGSCAETDRAEIQLRTTIAANLLCLCTFDSPVQRHSRSHSRKISPWDFVGWRLYKRHL